MRSEQPRIALVGYTNAGKSTLFNALTGADAYADDRLFATLDPTVRRVSLTSGAADKAAAAPGSGAVLADTVGFVRDLPHELVAAFRSTLSEAREADLLLHVVDAADPQRETRIEQVDAVLAEIGADDIPQLLVYNKIDRIAGAVARHDPAHPADQAWGYHLPGQEASDLRCARVWISARDGKGLDQLRQAIAGAVGMRRVRGAVRLPPNAGRLRARLHALEAVRDESHDDSPNGGGWHLRLDMALADAARLAAQADGGPLRALLPQPETMESTL